MTDDPVLSTAAYYMGAEIEEFTAGVKELVESLEAMNRALNESARANSPYWLDG